MSPTSDQAPLSAEDRKLVTLARATRARTRTAEGAAVRDADGRTYAAATVDLPSLQVSALGACVAMAVASGASGLEAAVVLTEAGSVAAADLDALRDLGGAGVVVHRGDARGQVVESSET
ncbi:cytidine deaminase [Nocardioides sp. SYSU DS0663]|uniref:cytidine deaminase n=1 Tax=Nocardioides sp. SYSU DS0663 TaxID=3416445 RepID=UPI003F4C0EE1